MRPYFEKMAGFGKELKENRIIRTKESRAKLEAVEAEISAARKARQDAGIPAAKINERGMLTVWQRLEYLVDAGSLVPAAQSLQSGRQSRGRHQRGRRSRQDRRALGGDHRF